MVPPVFSSVPGFVEPPIVPYHHVVGINGVEDDLMVIDMNPLGWEALEGHPLVFGALDIHVHGTNTPYSMRVSEELPVILGIHNDVIALFGPTLPVVRRPEKTAFLVLGRNGSVNHPGLMR